MAATRLARTPSGTTIPDRWDLTDLVKDPVGQLEAQLMAIDVEVSEIEAARDGLSPDLSPAAFASILNLSESVARSASRLGAYAYLWFSENTKDSRARSFKANVEERLTALQNRLLFFELWWQGIDETNAARLLDSTGGENHQCQERDRSQCGQHPL